MVRAKETSGHKVAELVQFGEAVRQQRKARGYSQEAFGDACGIDRSYMGGIERGEHNLALVNILKIIRALDMQPSEFFQALDVMDDRPAIAQRLEAPGQPAGSARRGASKHREALKALANQLVEEAYQQLLEKGRESLEKSRN